LSHFRLGFLGLLHLEVFSQRLENEYDAEVLITTPSVPFRVMQKLKILTKEIEIGSWPTKFTRDVARPVVCQKIL
jgi:translation elongation factor EF-4